MLTRVQIRGYKSFQDIDVKLGALALLFGPNSAGKSNFLDALQLLSAITKKRTLKEAFEPPYRGKPLESFSFGPGGIASLLKRDRASFSIEVDVRLSPFVKESVNRQILEMRKGSSSRDGKKTPGVKEEYLRYRVEIEILPKSGILRVSEEYLTALAKSGEPLKSRKPFIERVGDKIHLRMEGQSHPSYFDRYLDHTIVSRPQYAPHHPHVAALQAELASWRFFYFEPRERMRETTPVKEARHIGLMGEDLAAFLNTLKALAPKQFMAVEKALHRIVPSITGIDIRTSDLGQVELSLKEGDILVPARILSEGTLRILGLLALGGAEESAGLIGFEEPENGVHPGRINLISELLRTQATTDTQIIVTSHSPLLIDRITNECLLVVRKTSDAATEITPFNTWGPLGRKSDIDKALSDTPPSERVLRGDFDA